MEVLEVAPIADDRRQMLRRLTHADAREAEIKAVQSWEAGLSLVARHARTTRQKGRELVESIFWMGGAIAAAESYSAWGDKFYQTLHDQGGPSPATARRAVKLWDLFGGDVVGLHIWCSRFIEEHQRVLAGDITRLVNENREIASGNRHIRKVEASVEDFPEPMVIGSGLREARKRWRRQVKARPIKSPAGVVGMPKFKRIKPLKKAKEKLVFDPDAVIPIERVKLASGEYDLVVALKPAEQ